MYVWGEKNAEVLLFLSVEEKKGMLMTKRK